MRRMNSKITKVLCGSLVCAMSLSTVVSAATIKDVTLDVDFLDGLTTVDQFLDYDEFSDVKTYFDEEKDYTAYLVDSITAAIGGEETVGYDNGTATDMDLIARYASGTVDPDGGVVEIVAYNYETGYAYVVNGATGYLEYIDISGVGTADDAFTTLARAGEIDLVALMKSQDASFAYGDMTSVAVSPDGTLLAVALQADGTNDDGRIVVFTCNADGALTFVAAYTAGKQPDMVIFADDTTILAANEGEPRDGYASESDDPEGSITVVNLAEKTSVNYGFEDFSYEELIAANVILKTDASPARDLEPEYISVSNGVAYIALQENNAIAVFDLGTLSYTGIYSCGFIDYSDVKIDITTDGEYNPVNYDGVYGIRMPDGITTYEVNGKTYLVTANEGDGREYEWADGEYVTEEKAGKNEASLNGNIPADTIDNKVTYFVPSSVAGLPDSTADYLFGGRSFTIYEVSDNGLKVVFDSEEELEALTADLYLADGYYNVSNDNAEEDDRTAKKSIEPESVTIGEIDGEIYAFVGLERISGVVMYNVTDPANATYENYINTRDFEELVFAYWEYDDAEYALDMYVTGGDVAPEGLAFISAELSPTGYPILLVANEVSGTLAVYQISDYLYEEPVDTDEDSDTDVDADGDTDADADADTDADTDENDDAVAETGDDSNIAVLVAVMIMSAGFLVVVLGKKKTENA